MKKLVAILLLLIYTGGLGATINFHYCGGDIASVQFLSLNKFKDCGCSENDMPGDCCKDKLVYYRYDTHNFLQQPSIVKQVSEACQYDLIEYPGYTQNFPAVRFSFLNDRLKEGGDKRLYLLNSVLRI